jgi:hypothetical protein
MRSAHVHTWKHDSFYMLRRKNTPTQPESKVAGRELNEGSLEVFQLNKFWSRCVDVRYA